MSRVRLMVLACVFGFSPGIAQSQEGDPAPAAPAAAKIKNPPPSFGPSVFPVACIAVLLASLAIISIGLLFFWRSRTVSAATALFALGAVLVTCPVFGVAANYIGQIVAVRGMPADAAKAPDVNDLANIRAATFPLAVLMWATFFAVPFGLVALLAAFFFKEPAS